MSTWVKTLMSDLQVGLRALYGARLKYVFVFGSYARGEEDRESDLDVLVVLDDFERYGSEVDATSELTSKLSLQYGVSVSKVYVREQDWLNGQTPFLANVREEVVAA